MNNNDDKMKNKISELKGKVHIPFELIMADAREKLSAEGHANIESHLKTCKECGEAFQFVKESLMSGEADEKEITASDISIGLTIQPKLKLAMTVNSKRDEIAEKVAKLLLTKESWFAIRPAMAAYKNWLKTDIQKASTGKEKLALAALTDGDSEDRKEYEIIVSTIKFADYICDLLAERCNSLDEIGQKLPGFVDDGMALFDEVKLEQDMKEKILQLFAGIF